MQFRQLQDIPKYLISNDDNTVADKRAPHKHATTPKHTLLVDHRLLHLRHLLLLLLLEGLLVEALLLTLLLLHVHVISWRKLCIRNNARFMVFRL